MMGVSSGKARGVLVHSSGCRRLLRVFSGTVRLLISSASALCALPAAALLTQTITFNALPNKVYGAAPFAVSATATSGLPVSFSSLTLSVCTVGGSTVTIGATGTCTIRASQPGDATYAAAPDVDRSFTVAKASQTITFAALANKTYGNAPFTVSATASSGLAVSFASLTTGTCTVSATTVTIVAAGTCTVRASQAGNGNYNAAANVDRSFTIAKASQTIAFNALSNKTFGNPPFTVTATASSGLTVSFTSMTTAVCTVSGATVTMVAGGTCTIRASQSGDANYLAAANVDRSFTVAKANQTITFAPLPNVPYGTTPIALSATASSGLAVTFASTTTAFCTVSGTALTMVTVGTCSVRASQAGNGSYNAAPNVSQSFAIQKASQTITFPSIPEKQFGSAPFAITPTASSGLPVRVVSDNENVCSVADLVVTLLGVGACPLQANQFGNANYLAAPIVYASFNVVGTQSITFDSIPNQPLNAGAVPMHAVATSGLPVTFAALTPATCSVAGSSVTPIDVGTCTVQATQPGNATFQPAPPIDRSFTVLQTQTISFGSLASVRIGAPPFGLIATASSGLPVAFASLIPAVCAVSGSTVSLLTVGSCTLRASQAGNGTYAPAPDVDRTFAVLPPPSVQYLYDAAGNLVGIQRN